MRFLLMVLVLANLGFFAWQHWHGSDREDIPAGRADSTLAKGLVLVGEQTDAAQPPVRSPIIAETPAEMTADAPVSDDKASTDVSPATCASLGPFDQRDTATLALERLNGLGLDAVLRETGGQIRSGFWVYLPPFPSRSDAKQVEDELRDKNVRDLFIVTGSEQRNAISLGLFSTPERADQRAAEIGRLGYVPRVAERFRDASVYWVDFVERPDEPLKPNSVGVLGAGETLPEKRSIPCADIAVGGAEP